MKKDSYIHGAAFHAGGMLDAKIIGAIYRIPLSNIIGAEGIGIYQLVFPVYALLITMMGSGIPTTLSRLIAEKNTEGNLKGAKALFRNALLFFLIIGLSGALVLILISGLLGRIQNNSAVVTGYRLIAPAILMSTLIAAFRGWFQGNMNMKPSAISQITEQLVKLILGLLFAKIFIKYGLQYAVWGAIASITVSEIVALLIIFINFLVKHGRISEGRLSENISRKALFKELIAVMVPITLGGITLPLVQFIDSLLIVNLLKGAGNSILLSTKMYGMLSGPVGSLINMPVVLTLAFAVSVVPVVSRSRIERDINSIRAKSGISVKLTFVIGVPSALALFALAEPVMNVLYPKLSAYEIQLGAGLLKVSSISILLLSIMQIYTALLQAIDRAYTPFINMAIGGVVKIVLTVILIRYYGIYGAAISTIIAYISVALLNIAEMVKWTGRNQILFKNISTILLAGVIMCLSIILILSLIRAGSLVNLLIGTASGIFIYGIMLALLNIFTRDELKGMPMSAIFLKFRNTIRFWERANDNGSGDGKN